MNESAQVLVEGTLNSAEQQELITRSLRHFGSPPTPADARILPITILGGVVLAAVLALVFHDASWARVVAVLLLGVVGGYIMGLRRVGAVGTHLVGWSFRPDGARDNYESGGYLFHPWPVLTVVWAEWGILAASDRRPVLFVPARLLTDRVDVAHIVAMAEAGGAKVKEAH